jgi:hypothetical protein
MGDLDDAIGSLTDAVQRKDAYVAARLHLGEAYRRKGDFAAAKASLDLAKTLIEASDDAADQELLDEVEASLKKVEAGDAGA